MASRTRHGMNGEWLIRRGTGKQEGLAAATAAKTRVPKDYPNFRSSLPTELSETQDSIVNVGYGKSAQRRCFFNLTHFAGIVFAAHHLCCETSHLANHRGGGSLFVEVEECRGREGN